MSSYRTTTTSGPPRTWEQYVKSPMTSWQTSFTQWLKKWVFQRSLLKIPIIANEGIEQTTTTLSVSSPSGLTLMTRSFRATGTRLQIEPGLDLIMGPSAFRLVLKGFGIYWKLTIFKSDPSTSTATAS